MLDTNYWQVQDWQDISTHFSIIHKTSLWGAWNIEHHGVAILTLKNSKLKVHGFLKENKLACFTNSEDLFQLLNLVRDFWKNYYLRQYKIHVSSPWQSMHVYTKKSQQTRHTKKFFQPLKINFVCAYDFCRYEPV